MINKIRNILIVFMFFIFIFFTINHYFSNKNIIHVNKSRSTYNLLTFNELPVLKNDTNNIIVFKDDIEEFKKKRKKRFWEKLISND
jgi:hypothetical protein